MRTVGSHCSTSWTSRQDGRLTSYAGCASPTIIGWPTHPVEHACTVFSTEALNTAFELLCDVAAPNVHPLVEAAKDVAAGAVLICAVGAAVTGVLVLGPPLATILANTPCHGILGR
jgi:hypothetical protein